MKAENFHDLLLASWRTRKASSIIQSWSKGLRIWEVMVYISIWAEFSRREDKCLSSSNKSKFTLFLLFVLFRPSIEWIMSSHIGTPLLSLKIQMTIYSGNTSQTHPEMFYQQSRHTLAQASWHIKLTIISSNVISSIIVIWQLCFEYNFIAFFLFNIKNNFFPKIYSAF